MLKLNATLPIYDQGSCLIKGSVNASEVLLVNGPSGCGKTTFLRALCGYINWEPAEYLLNGRDYKTISASKRRIGLCYQDVNLLPSLTVEKNLDLPLAYNMPFSSWNARRRLDRVQEFLNYLGLLSLTHKYPSELSGGQARRVALLRSVIFEPSLLLLDEPSSGIDDQTKKSMLHWLELLISQTKVPVIITSHDQDVPRYIKCRKVEWSGGDNCLNF